MIDNHVINASYQLIFKAKDPHEAQSFIQSSLVHWLESQEAESDMSQDIDGLDVSEHDEGDGEEVNDDGGEEADSGEDGEEEFEIGNEITVITDESRNYDKIFDEALTKMHREFMKR